MSRKNKELIFLLIILALATFFRLWQLNLIPPGLYPDIAMNGNDALNSLKTGDFKLFYPDNNGREGLMMWLIALSFSVFGVSIWSIKIVAAILGILTVLGLYLLTKELFIQATSNQRRATVIALLASFFLAISFWHVNFSRIGFRAILLPFILVFSFYFLFRGFSNNKLFRDLKTGNLLNFILAGVFFGLGFYTYTSFRLAVLILPFVFIPYWLIAKKQGSHKEFLSSIFYFLTSTFLIALPIGIYFLHHPQDFLSRATPISVFSQPNPLLAVGKSLVLHLGMFNVSGDWNWRHNLAGQPQLFWPIGILFLIGLILSFIEVFKKSSYHNKNYQSLSIFYFLLSSFFLMLLPGVLTSEGIPHSLRTIGVIPAVFIFTGLGAWQVFEILKKWNNKKRTLIFVSLFFLLSLALFEYNRYFVLWGQNPKTKEAFTQNYYDIGNYLNTLPDWNLKYVIVNEPGSPLYGISIPAQVPMFIESTKFGQPRTTYLKFENLKQMTVSLNRLVIVPLYDGQVFETLAKKLPGGKIIQKTTFSIYFW